MRTPSALQDTVTKNPDTERKLFDSVAISSSTDFLCARRDTARGTTQTKGALKNNNGQITLYIPDVGV